MKEGWEIKKLGDVCTLYNGRAYKKVELLTEGKYPVLRVGNFFTNNQWYHSDLELEENKYCEEGDLLYAWSASFGPRIWTGPKVIYHYHIWKVVPYEGIDRDFLFHLLEWDIEKIKKAHGTGTTMMHVGKGSMEKRELPIPPLPEQQRIVSILDRAFAAIDKAKANAEQNLQNAKELFESYLQGIVSNGDQWEKKTLAQIAKTFGRGKSKHRPRNWEGLYGGDYPFIQTGDIRNSKHYITEYSQTYNEVGLAQSKLWPAGTICITIAANIAETGVLTFDACFPDSVIGIEVNEKFADREFVEYLLQSFKVRIQALGKGSAQANINLGTFENELFPFPPVTEQKEIVDKLNQLFNECERLENVFLRKIDDLEELKKSILQKAFAGELPVRQAGLTETKQYALHDENLSLAAEPNMNKSRRDETIIENKMKNHNPTPKG